MTEDDEIRAMVVEIQTALKATHGIGGRSLETSLRRTGRLLPKKLHKQGGKIVDALSILGHPRVGMMLDMDDLRAARSAILENLDQVDVADRRKGRILSLAGVLVFNVFAVVAGVIIWLSWSGNL